MKSPLMFGLRLVVETLAAAGFAIPLAGPAAAGTFEVAPTTIFLPHGAQAAVFYITNRDPGPIAIQVEGLEWQETGGTDHLTASDAVSFSPPIVRLAPGQRQTIRLTVSPDPTTDERAFRLLVRELPDRTAPNASGVRVMLNFNIPVFIASAHNASPKMAWGISHSANGYVLTLNNTGVSHLKLDQLLVDNAGSEQNPESKPFVYLLAGQTHSWTLGHGVLRAGQEIHIKGHDEASGSTFDTAVSVPG